MRTRTIKVVPNPYLALDADGRAQGVVAKEGHADLYVGATLDAEESRKAGKFIFTISNEAVEVPATAYYMRRLQERDLIPADADAASYAGMGKDFRGPEAMLAKERETAMNLYGQATGRDPAFLESEQRPAGLEGEGEGERRDEPGPAEAEVLRSDRSMDPHALRSPPVPTSAYRGSSPPPSLTPKRTY